MPVEQKYIDYWKRRFAEEQKKAELQAKEVRAELEAVIALLRDLYGARRIILFGEKVAVSYDDP